MGREVERKYLVTDDRWRQAVGSGVHYRQGYLCTDPQRSVRVRLAANEAALFPPGPLKKLLPDPGEALADHPHQLGIRVVEPQGDSGLIAHTSA